MPKQEELVHTHEITATPFEYTSRTNNGKVIVRFHQPVLSLNLTPHQALKFAKTLIEKAEKAKIANG